MGAKSLSVEYPARKNQVVMARKAIIARLVLLAALTGLGLAALFVFHSIKPKQTTPDSAKVTKHHHHRIHRHRRRHHH